MGIFAFFDVTKGRDYPEPSSPFIRYWYRYYNRFFHLIRANLMFFMVSLPFYIWAMTLYNSYIVERGLENIALMSALIAFYLESIPAIILVILVILSVIFTGPAWAGLTFVACRYSQGRHAWVWADFRVAFCENLKQAIPVGILEALIIFVTFYYLNETEAIFGKFEGAARIIWFLLLILYICCRMYLFPMMVSVKLPLGQLFKNSVLLVFIKPLRTLLCFALLIGLVILCIFADIVMLPLFAYAFFSFASSAIIYPVLKKIVFEPDS